MAEKKLERNPKTKETFHRETWWQVIFPVVFVTVLLIVFVVAIYPLFGLIGASVMADYSVIFVFALVTTFAILIFATIVGFIYMTSKMLNVVPPYTYKAQKAVTTARDVTDKYTDKMAQSVIEARSRAVAVATIMEKLQKEDKNTQEKTPTP